MINSKKLEMKRDLAKGPVARAPKCANSVAVIPLLEILSTPNIR